MTALLRALGSQAPRTFSTIAQPRFGSNSTSLSDRVQRATRNFCSDSSSRCPSEFAHDVNKIEQNDQSFLFRAKKAAQVFQAASELPKNKNVETILEAAKLELDESTKPLREKAEINFLSSSFTDATRDYARLLAFDPNNNSIATMLALSKKYSEQPLPTW